MSGTEPPPPGADAALGETEGPGPEGETEPSKWGGRAPGRGGLGAARVCVRRPSPSDVPSTCTRPSVCTTPWSTLAGLGHWLPAAAQVFEGAGH